MRPWMKAGLLVVLVLGLSWGGAIWYWRATNRMPANGDLAIYLVALPLGINYHGRRQHYHPEAPPKRLF